MLKYLLYIIFICVAAVVNAQTTKEETVNVNGSIRKIRIHIPAGLPDNAPLVISMHGMNQDPEYQMNTTNWNDYADKNKFVVVYPYGENKMWDIGGDKDVNFIKMIIRQMYNEYRINKNRVYASGFSMGGMMTYHLITKIADQIAAFAPVSGIPVDNRNPSGKRHVPLIHHHGSADDVVKFGGDPYHAAGGYRPITDYVTAWAKWNGCDVTKPKVTMSANDKSTVWMNEKEGIKNVYNILDGVGHWHSNNTWGGINTTDAIWQFIRRYSLDNDMSFAVANIRPTTTGSPLNAQSTISIGFSEKVYAKTMVVTLEGQGQKIELVNQSTSEKGQIAKFVFPKDTELVGGEYKLKMTNVKMVDDNLMGKIEYTYQVEGNVSAINTTTSDVTPTQFYTLDGATANESTKGIVIAHGKKILKK